MGQLIKYQDYLEKNNLSEADILQRLLNKEVFFLYYVIDETFYMTLRENRFETYEERFGQFELQFISKVIVSGLLSLTSESSLKLFKERETYIEDFYLTSKVRFERKLHRDKHIKFLESKSNTIEQLPFYLIQMLSENFLGEFGRSYISFASTSEKLNLCSKLKIDGNDIDRIIDEIKGHAAVIEFLRDKTISENEKQELMNLIDDFARGSLILGKFEELPRPEKNLGYRTYELTEPIDNKNHQIDRSDLLATYYKKLQSEIKSRKGIIVKNSPSLAGFLKWWKIHEISPNAVSISIDSIYVLEKSQEREYFWSQEPEDNIQEQIYKDETWEEDKSETTGLLSQLERVIDYALFNFDGKVTQDKVVNEVESLLDKDDDLKASVSRTDIRNMVKLAMPRDRKHNTKPKTS